MKFNLLRITLIFFIGLILSTSAPAKNIFVSVNGSDNANGESEKSAFKTLQKAADVAEPWDVILIGDGNYSNNNTQDNSAVLSIKNSGKENG